MNKGTVRTIRNLGIRSVDFNVISSGDKKAVFRMNDHEYKKGDFLGLYEVDDKDNLTDDFIIVKVTDVGLCIQCVYSGFIKSILMPNKASRIRRLN
ncbi:DUF3850 domain-containing protein [Xenorhabdus japonica]|uniref:DUF3850 domain-containing protein n=1 Tax=Xenorhabdus japonica TaxID=53341 RepID=A0A1I5B728_9GAMM|nr:DUF3850 domain-containing protein [Xenorhabdus japonica]SFN70504.1 protein of unknown function [Xenorhabdus japonica]